MTEPAEPRVIAEFTSYDEMLDAVRARANELAINGERFDDYAGLPRGYLSKLIGVNPVRRIAHASMAPLFAALGVRCLMVEDQAATERLQARLKPRNPSYVRSALRITITDRKLRELGKRGRTNRWSKLTPAQRSQIMRILALKRWRG